MITLDEMKRSQPAEVIAAMDQLIDREMIER
jgi:hypothetical protein